MFGQWKIDGIIQGFKGPALKVTPHKDTQTLMCFSTTSPDSVRPLACWAQFLCPSLREGLCHLTRGCWAGSSGVFAWQNQVTRWPPQLLLQHLPGPISHSVRSMGWNTSSSLQTLSQIFGAPQFDISDTEKGKAPPGQKVNYLWTIWLPVKLLDSRPRSVPPPGWPPSQEADGHVLSGWS